MNEILANYADVDADVDAEAGTSTRAIVWSDVALELAAREMEARGSKAVYVLELEHGCVYVGVSTRVFARIHEHFAPNQDKASAWTRAHRPKRVLAVQEGGEFLESALTQQLMCERGIDFVRGGEHATVDLHAQTRKDLALRFASWHGECFACGAAGHVALACPARKSKPASLSQAVAALRPAPKLDVAIDARSGASAGASGSGSGSAADAGNAMGGADADADAAERSVGLRSRASLWSTAGGAYQDVVTRIEGQGVPQGALRVAFSGQSGGANDALIAPGAFFFHRENKDAPWIAAGVVVRVAPLPPLTHKVKRYELLVVPHTHIAKTVGRSEGTESGSTSDSGAIFLAPTALGKTAACKLVGLAIPAQDEWYRAGIIAHGQ